MRRSVFALLVGAIAFFALTADTCNTSGGSPAGGSSGSSPGGTVTVPKGQALKASNGETVSVTGYQTGVTDPNGLTSPPAGKQCVRVSVSLTNGSSNEWSDPPIELTIVDANGQKYDTLSSLGSCPTSTSISSLVAGGHGTADLYYEVPATGPLDLNWTPTLSGEVYQTPLQ